MNKRQMYIKDRNNINKNERWNEIINVEFQENDFPKLISSSDGILDKLIIDLMDKDLKKKL